VRDLYVPSTLSGGVKIVLSYVKGKGGKKKLEGGLGSVEDSPSQEEEKAFKFREHTLGAIIRNDGVGQRGGGEGARETPRTKADDTRVDIQERTGERHVVPAETQIKTGNQTS